MKKMKKVIAIALMATILGTAATSTTASAHHHSRTSSKKYYYDNCPYKNCNLTCKHTHKSSKGYCHH